MTGNLLLWRWSQDYDTPQKRQKKAVKFSNITSMFVETNDHPSIGQGNIAALRKAIDLEFGDDENNRPLVFYDHGKCAVVNYPNAVRIEVLSRISSIARRLGLNTSEF